MYILPQYENDVMVALKRDENYVLMKTYSRNAGSRGRFFIDAEKLSQWMDNYDISDFWDKDGGNILRITWNRTKGEFIIQMWWMSSTTNGKLSGVLQTVEIDAWTFGAVLVRNEWTRVLCKPGNNAQVKFIWTESANNVLRKIQKDKQMKRALCKAFARGCLAWPNTEITMYDDFSKGSFFFRTNDGICGGLILHRGIHDNMSYSVHT